MQSRVYRWLYDRLFRGRERLYLDPSFPWIDDYRYDSRPRYGYGRAPHAKLAQRIDKHRENYARQIADFQTFEPEYRKIASNRDLFSSKPTFFNEYLIGFDPIALYSFLATQNSRRYFEIGSGFSTKFARHAIQQHQLKTSIHSIDPHPRTGIDALCDESIRSPLDSVDVCLFDQLGAGDILFIDHSHRCFMNSDATVVALDILPRLKPGVLVQFHDIFLPYDYPPAWQSRYYSEQYLLASLLLADEGRYEILFASAAISLDTELRRLALPLWEHPDMQAVSQYSQRMMHGYLGYSFWLRTPPATPPHTPANESIEREPRELT